MATNIQNFKMCYYIDTWWLVHTFISEIYFTMVAVTDVLRLCMLGHSILYIANFKPMRRTIFLPKCNETYMWHQRTTIWYKQYRLTINITCSKYAHESLIWTYNKKHSESANFHLAYFEECEISLAKADRDRTPNTCSRLSWSTSLENFVKIHC